MGLSSFHPLFSHFRSILEACAFHQLFLRGSSSWTCHLCTWKAQPSWIFPVHTPFLCQPWPGAPGLSALWCKPQHLPEQFKELPGGQKYQRPEKKLWELCAHLSVAVNATDVFFPPRSPLGPLCFAACRIYTPSSHYCLRGSLQVL